MRTHALCVTRARLPWSSEPAPRPPGWLWALSCSWCKHTEGQCHTGVRHTGRPHPRFTQKGATGWSPQKGGLNPSERRTEPLELCSTPVRGTLGRSQGPAIKDAPHTSWFTRRGSRGWMPNTASSLPVNGVRYVTQNVSDSAREAKARSSSLSTNLRE